MPGLMEEVKKKVNRPVPELLPLTEESEAGLNLKQAIAAVEPVEANGAANGGHHVTSLNDAIAHFQQDAPTCPSCGHVTVRNGACYKCLNCGESLGCS
jgi:ribonucleoside-diphosphate reductase alpha chain